MMRLKLIGALCAATLMTAGAASAAPMAHEQLGIGAPVSTVAMMMKGPRTGKMKQRQRTRITRCNKTPSRC